MRYDPDRHHRRSIRLKGYDYSQAGTYFVTIRTRDGVLAFENETVRGIAERCWIEIPRHVPYVLLDEWVVMPNHIHGIITICRGVQLNAPTATATATAVAAHGTNESTRTADSRFSAMSPQRNALPVIIRTYKAAVTTQCRKEGFGHFAWQRGYDEHIVRDEEECSRIRRYIADNPLRWTLGREKPEEESPWSG